MAKVILIGLDGAGFRLIDRWLDPDTLPTLSKLKDGGRWASLESSLPPVTSPAWRCYSTGVNPGKHGVFWWEQIDREAGSISVPTSESYKAPDLWDYLGEGGFESAVINMPTTHPPRELNGWMVSGGDFADEYTFPDSLRAELEEELGYRSSLEVPVTAIKDDPGQLPAVLEFIDQRFDAAKYVKEEYDPDFIHLTIFHTNSVQHFHWGGEVNRRLWRRVDRNISELVDDGENTIVMSDHGSNEIETVFNINSWLEENGYLVTRRRGSDYLFELGITRERLIDLLGTLRLGKIAKRLVPDSLVDVVPSSDMQIGKARKGDRIDWTNSRAVASGQGPIYVLAEEEREQVVADLKAALEGLRGPDGAPVARRVFEADEIYEGPYVEAGPDLVIEQADGVHIPGVIGHPETFVDPDDWKWESENHRDGIFIAHGPDVDGSGTELSEKPTIYDVAPTILHWFGLPIPEGLDGTVLTEVFEPGSAPAEREITYGEYGFTGERTPRRSSAEGELRARLEELGYLSE